MWDELYRAELSARGFVCSMSRVGDCWDNAVAESFFATLKTELIDRRPSPTKAEARSAVHDYIGAFFNPHRRLYGTGSRPALNQGLPRGACIGLWHLNRPAFTTPQ